MLTPTAFSASILFCILDAGVFKRSSSSNLPCLFRYLNQMLLSWIIIGGVVKGVLADSKVLAVLAGVKKCTSSMRNQIGIHTTCDSSYRTIAGESMDLSYDTVQTRCVNVYSLCNKATNLAGATPCCHSPPMTPIYWMPWIFATTINTPMPLITWDPHDFDDLKE
jgi:hypothetical protein